MISTPLVPLHERCSEAFLAAWEAMAVALNRLPEGNTRLALRQLALRELEALDPNCESVALRVLVELEIEFAIQAVAQQECVNALRV